MSLKSKNLPSQSSEPCPARSLLRSETSALRVYTDIPQVEELLTRPEFVISTHCHSDLHNFEIKFPF